SLWASRSDAAIARSARRRKALQRLTPRALQLESAKIVADLCREGLGGGAVEGGACGGAGEEGAHRAEAAAEGAQHAFAQGGLRGGAERAGERAGLQRVDAALAGPGRDERGAARGAAALDADAVDLVQLGDHLDLDGGDHEGLGGELGGRG